MDQPRQHHDIGGIPRSMHREVDTDLHARLVREADTLRRIRCGQRMGPVDERRRAVETLSAVGDRRRSDEGGRIGRIGDDLPRFGAVTLPGSAAAPGRASAGLRPASLVRVRDLRPARCGLVRRRTCRDVVLRRLVPENVAERRSLVVPAPCARGPRTGWPAVPPGSRRIRATVASNAGGATP